MENHFLLGQPQQQRTRKGWVAREGGRETKIGIEAGREAEREEAGREAEREVGGEVEEKERLHHENKP